MSWYVVRTRAGLEHGVALWLLTRTVVSAAYVPCYRERRRLPALFPGYVFARFELPAPADIYQAPGVIRATDYSGGGPILRVRGVPCCISDADIEQIRLLEEAGAVPGHALRAGEHCEVRLRGIHVPCRFERADGRRAWVSVEILGREVSVPVMVSDVRKVA